MILELDCGNSFIKWRIFPSGTLYIAYSLNELFLTLATLEGVKLCGARISSVRDNLETSQIAAKIKMRFGVKVQIAESTKFCAGVTNGYLEPEKLGVDRWLDVLGAYHLSKKACVVFDLGTAITADFVASDGKHLGGFICPGLPLMRSGLRFHTSKISYNINDTKACLKSIKPGTFTAEAAERGCLVMICGFVKQQIEHATNLFNDDFAAFITGGDAKLIHNFVPCAKFVPDLVFTGLALACPFDC